MNFFQEVSSSSFVTQRSSSKKPVMMRTSMKVHKIRMNQPTSSYYKKVGSKKCQSPNGKTKLFKTINPDAKKLRADSPILTKSKLNNGIQRFLNMTPCTNASSTMGYTPFKMAKNQISPAPRISSSKKVSAFRSSILPPAQNDDFVEFSKMFKNVVGDNDTKLDKTSFHCALKDLNFVRRADNIGSKPTVALLWTILTKLVKKKVQT